MFSSGWVFEFVLGKVKERERVTQKNELYTPCYKQQQQKQPIGFSE